MHEIGSMSSVQQSPINTTHIVTFPISSHYRWLQLGSHSCLGAESNSPPGQLPLQCHGAATVVLQLAEQPGLVAALWRCSSASQLVSSSHVCCVPWALCAAVASEGEHELAKRK